MQWQLTSQGEVTLAVVAFAEWVWVIKILDDAVGAFIGGVLCQPLPKPLSVRLS